LIEVTPKRIELKCLYKETDLPFLEKNLLLSDLSFYQPYPPRFINSLYYDSHFLLSIGESLDGSSLRTKFRCRWYGDLIKDTKATFELKKKLGHISWKVLIKNIFKINSASKTWSDFISPEVSSSLGSFRIIAINQCPTSIVRYRRKYFVSSDSKIRVTIDDQLQFFDQRLSSKPNTKISETSHAGLVLEIKLQEKEADLLPVISNSINFTPSRFSKYCESVMNRV
jgi:hypothetical protein